MTVPVVPYGGVDQRPQPRVLAVMVAYNEADVIGASIAALVKEGCQAYVVDHGSTDGTGDIAREWLGRGVVAVERFPEDSGFPERNATTMVWADLLRRRAQIIGEHEADWYVLHDADEIREAPWPGLTFAEGLAHVEALGYNAVGFRLFNFRPVDGRFRSGDDPRVALTGYELGDAWDGAQVKAFKRPPGAFDIVASGGHDVRFEGRRACPVPFILRHYPIRSPEHGVRKVLRERLPRFAREERSAGWHVQYDRLVADGARFVWDPAKLTQWNGAAVRAELLARTVDQVLLSSFVRGHDLGALVIDDACARRRLEAVTGATVADARYATARQAFDALCQGESPGRVAQDGSSVAPLISELLHMLCSQVALSGDQHALSAAHALAQAFGSACDALAAQRLELDGVRSFVALVRAEEAVADPGLLSTFAEAFDAGADATLVIHAPGWSDAEVSDRLLPALATAALDGPDAPDMLAVTAPLDERALSARVDALVTAGGAEAPWTRVPHVTVGGGRTLRDLYGRQAP